MSRKTKTNTKTVIEDNYRGPKAEPKKTVTLAEALAESGETLEDLQTPPEDEKPEREEGQSNLATTIRNHRKRYVTALHPNGKKTQNNGDTVAALLLPIPLDKLQAFSAATFGAAYTHLNPGHARMCIGNRIRAAVKKGDEHVLAWLHANQPSDPDLVEEQEPKAEEPKPAKKATKKATKKRARKAPAKKATKKAE